MENLVNATPNFWQDRRVLITGHTGFKGAWLTLWLLSKGAIISGLALPPENDSLFDRLLIQNEVNNFFEDITTANLDTVIEQANPEVIFHLAAQAIVNESVEHPIQTWLTNVIGSARLYEACSRISSKCALISVTSDKVYEDNPTLTPYKETHPIGGSDPYSASKAANEILLKSWQDTFFLKTNIRATSVRAGNVIGGGDWSKDRIFPDIFRAYHSGLPLELRNPSHARPWQHVLDPLNGYITLAQKLFENSLKTPCGSFNFGPLECEPKTVQHLVKFVSKNWNLTAVDVSKNIKNIETHYLSLNIDKAARNLGWFPKWNFERSVRETMKWYDQYKEGRPVSDITLRQIEEFETS